MLDVAVLLVSELVTNSVRHSGSAVPGGQVTVTVVTGEGGCYRPRWLNIQRLDYLWTIRHSSTRITGNLIT